MFIPGPNERNRMKRSNESKGSSKGARKQTDTIEISKTAPSESTPET